MIDFHEMAKFYALAALVLAVVLFLAFSLLFWWPLIEYSWEYWQ